MPRAHRPSAEFPAHLETLYREFPFARSFADDPVSCLRPLATDPRSAEASGVFLATLAVGQTAAIRGAFARLTERAGGDLATAVRHATAANHGRLLSPFQHRWIRGDQMGYLALRLRTLYASYPSLEALFLEGLDAGDFAHGIDALARGLRGGAGDPPSPPGYAALFPTPLGAPRSPCKRLTLYVRWMVRPRFPDLGLWSHVPAGELRVPLDQHVYWIAYHLGLTRRRTRSWAAVEEVTEALRRIDPLDPTRYDFVLCHTGISGDCPKRRDLAVCGPCSVRADCRLWRGRAAA